MFDSKIFGEHVKKLRIEKQISQVTLGESLGIGKSAVSMIENGQRSASIEVASKIADYFDVPIDYLLGRGPFSYWEMVMKYHDPLCKKVMEEAPFLEALPIPLAELPEKEFMAVIAATLANIEYKEKDGQPHFTLTFYPVYVDDKGGQAI